MNTNSTKIMFMHTMMIGVMVSMCSNSWMMVWAGLEMSLMSFIPMLEKDSVLSTESSIKYFIIQSMSSSLMILGFILNMKIISWTMISYSMFTKMGTAPFHQWMVSMSEGMTYSNLFILLSVMKLPPMTILMYNKTMNFTTSIMSLIIGSMAGLNQTSMKKILTYSSIYNMGFMLMVTEMTTQWTWFILIYSIMMMMTLMLFKKMNILYMNQIMINNYKMLSKTSMWMLMMSLSGMPPTMGFMNKIMIIEMMLQKNQMVISSIMIFSSLIMTFYYLRMMFSSFLLQSTLNKWNLKINKNTMINVFLITFNSSPILMTLKCIN